MSRARLVTGSSQESAHVRDPAGHPTIAGVAQGAARTRTSRLVWAGAGLAVIGSVVVSAFAGCGSQQSGPSSSSSGDAGNGQFGSVEGVDCTKSAMPGCRCSTAGEQASCWTGPADQMGVGACKPGTTTCTGRGEFPTWGPCEGEVIDCGVNASAGPSPVTNSCGRVALAYGSERFPSTVCLLASDGTLKCAVNPADSAIGGKPLLPSSPLSDVACISGGEDFFCAVTHTGGVVCWGDAAAFDPAAHTSLPGSGGDKTLTIPGLPSIIDVAAGETHVCVLTASHSVMCWGKGTGELNSGSWAPPASPTVVDIGGSAMAIASGDGFSCALRDDGVILCWGNNGKRVLGVGTTAMSATPVVTPLPAKAVGVWADQGMSPCAMLNDGSVWCWGNGGAPAQVKGFSGPVKALTVGGEGGFGGEDGYSCAVTETGGVQCWAGTSAPTDLLPAGSGVVELRSNDFDDCALLSTGAVKCWSTAHPATVVTVPGL